MRDRGCRDEEGLGGVGDVHITCRYTCTTAIFLQDTSIEMVNTKTNYINLQEHNQDDYNQYYDPHHHSNDDRRGASSTGRGIAYMCACVMRYKG